MCVLVSQVLIQTTYELEGDRLELLLVHNRIEALRHLGQAIRDGDAVLPNVDAVLRHSVSIVPGVKIEKHFDGYGMCEGTVRSSDRVESTIYPGQVRLAYKVVYAVDGTSDELEEEEIRPLIIVREDAERAKITAVLQDAFAYLEDRITGMCHVSQYSCAHMYDVCRSVQLFNPVFAASHLTNRAVDLLYHTVKPLTHHVSLELLKAEIPAYLSAASEIESIDVSDVATFTSQVLRFWRSASKTALKQWCKAAMIVFSMSPNSAACERVFSLLENMYGDQQLNSLADTLQASLMLRYNGRSV